MTNLTVENVYTRQAAKELTHKHFWKLLGMMLTALAVTYAVMFGCTDLTALFVSSADTSPLVFVLSLISMLVTYLVASGLGLGMTSAMLYVCRDGAHPNVGQVFSRMGQCLKAFGLGLWVTLKLMLWMLPGYALMIGSVFAFAVGIDSITGTVAWTESEVGVLALLVFGSMLLMFALIIPAAYRYMLSSYILADKPETSVFDCVRQSKAMMKGHKWQAFKLVVPLFLLVYGGMFALLFILMLLTALLGESTAAITVIGFVAMIALLGFVLYLAMRMALGYCLFYLKRCEEQDAPPAAPESAE